MIETPPFPNKDRNACVDCANTIWAFSSEIMKYLHLTLTLNVLNASCYVLQYKQKKSLLNFYNTFPLLRLIGFSVCAQFAPVYPRNRRRLFCLHTHFFNKKGHGKNKLLAAMLLTGLSNILLLKFFIVVNSIEQYCHTRFRLNVNINKKAMNDVASKVKPPYLGRIGTKFQNCLPSFYTTLGVCNY